MRRLTEGQREMVVRNMGMIGVTLRRFRRLIRTDVDYGEAYGAAQLALCAAAAGYRGDRGATFATYAAHAMRHAVASELLDRGLIRTPRASRGAAATARKRAWRDRVRDATASPAGLGEAPGRGRGPLDAAIAAEFHRALDAMPGREGEVMRGAREGLTNVEIGRRLGITGERVRQIRGPVEARLRRQFGGGES